MHALLLRKDAWTLELVVPPGRSVTGNDEGNLFRGASRPLRVGDELDVPGMRVRVLEVGADGPRRVRYTFDRALEDPSLTWIAEGAEGFRDAVLPKPGFGTPLEP